MILGMVFTMAPMKADAATYQDVLNVLAVDENGTPLVNVELVFEKDGITYDFDTTDANGKISDFNIQDDTEAIMTAARKKLCQLSILKWQQMDGLNTALPVGVRKIKVMRTLTTESLL